MQRYFYVAEILGGEEPIAAIVWGVRRPPWTSCAGAPAAGKGDGGCEMQLVNDASRADWVLGRMCRCQSVASCYYSYLPSRRSSPRQSL